MEIRNWLQQIKPVIGMVHLLPLPGSPRVEDPKVQAAVRRKVLKGETVGFFRAIDKIVPDPLRDVNIKGELKMIQWPDDEDVSEF